MNDETKAAPTEITPQILRVIQTAAAVFVAKKMQWDAENRALPSDKSWSIKGREIAEASHNLIQRGH